MHAEMLAMASADLRGLAAQEDLQAAEMDAARVHSSLFTTAARQAATRL